MLRKAGFTITKNPSGSHTTWGHPDGRSIPVPTGHRTISPGVYRKILDILKEER
ncbi:hypothetical protein GCM10028787_32950 [Brachybacterium horti]